MTTCAIIVKHMRQILNLSQAAFGEKIGLSQNTVSAYELGKMMPSIKVARQLHTMAKTLKLKVHMDDFYSGV